MKPFSKSEIISVAVIFVILVAVSIPNFIISLRRARDQVRRDDMGALVGALAEYVPYFQAFPASSADGRIVDCLTSGEKPVKDKTGGIILNAIPCDWGKDAFVNLLTGKVYMPILPREPDYQKGAKYLFFSDGERYQIYAAMEGIDEPEVDTKIIALGLKCGIKICNVGRSFSVPTNISIEEYGKSLLNSNVKK
jgi:hypothetical protein